MESLHCNGCGHLPHFALQDKRRYFLASCGHVYCQNCANQLQDVCMVCKGNCRLVEINGQSKSEIKMYFLDPMTVLRESFKQTTQVFNFQKSQQKSFQSMISRLVEAHKGVVSELNVLKMEVASLRAVRDENQALKRKIETMEQEHQNWIGTGNSNPVNESRPFSMQNNISSTPHSSFTSLFGDSRGLMTPGFVRNNSDQSRGVLFTPTPPSSSGPGLVSYGPGRLTLNRTPTPDGQASRRRFESPAAFAATPGAGRPMIPQTPDLVTRLRQLRCTTKTPNY